MTRQRIRKFRETILLWILDGVGWLVVFQFLHFISLAFPNWQSVELSLGLLSKREFSIGLLGFFLFAANEGLYFKRRPFWDETLRIVRSATYGLFFLILSSFLLSIGADRLSLSAVIVFGASLVFILPSWRYFSKIALFYLRIWREPVLIIGAGQSGQAVAEGLMSNPYLGYHVIGFLDDSREKIGQKVEIGTQKIKIFGAIRHFRKFINLLHLSTVILAIPSMRAERLSNLTKKIQKYCRNIILIPDLKGVALLNVELNQLFDQQLFLLHINNNLLSLFNRLVKRIFDLTISLILLPMVLPLIAFLAILVYLETFNNPFFVQKRLGKGKSVFNCIKFQTMYPNADSMLEEFFKKNPDKKKEWDEFKKIKGFDPRVTKVGAILRKTSLDELPQIFNVLKGDMSLVGPRPYLPREEIEMKDYIDTILLTPPGITGLWQVRGRNETNFINRMRLDAWYVLNWTLWVDIEILFKTLLVVFLRKGAY